MPSSNLPTVFQLSVRASLAAGLAIAAARLLTLQYPIYAMISAVIVTDITPAKTRALAVPRLVGTALGALMGAMIDTVLPSHLWVVVVAILIAMFFAHLIHVAEAAKVAGYVCGIVLLDHGQHPWSYAVLRMLETFLGIAAAVLLSFAPGPMSFKRRREP